MLYKKEINEALDIMNNMLDALMEGSSLRGEEGSSLRSAVGDLIANAPDLVQDHTIGTELGLCFEQARKAGTTLSNMDNVRIAMCNEAPVYDFGIAMKNAGIVFSFVEQCLIIADMTFVSRFDVEVIMTKMVPVVDDIKLEIAELIDGASYVYVVELAAAMVQHLASTERQLPRIVRLTTTYSVPSLRLANLLYNDSARSNEIEDENKVVHPAFCPRSLRVLSA